MNSVDEYLFKDISDIIFDDLQWLWNDYELTFHFRCINSQFGCTLHLGL